VGARFKSDRRNRTAAFEAPGRNLLNLFRDSHVCFLPKIPNEASPAEIDEKITGNSDKRIPGIDRHAFDSNPNHCLAGELAEASGKEKRPKRFATGKRTAAKGGEFRIGLKCDIRKGFAIPETVVANCLN
jgi:hypothetical protein